MARAPIRALLLASVGMSCFSGDATLGSLCREDADCGGGQVCTNEVCGLCGNGVAEPGEVCFDATDQIELGPDPVLIRPQDVDRDGSLDLVTLAPGADQVQLLRGQAASFSDPEPVSLPIAAQLLAVGDLDGDNTVDAVVADAVSLRLGLGSGTLAFSFGEDAVSWPGATGLELAPASTVSTAFGVATRPAMDPMMDLMMDPMMDPASTEVVALRVDDTGVLRLGDAIELPGTARPVGVGQLSGDATPEVLLAAGPTITVLSGEALQTVTTLQLAADVASIVIADIDGDGERDVLSADATGAVRVDVGDGSGSFQSADLFAFPDAPGGMIVGDLDRDRDRDIAAASLTHGVELQLARGPRFPDTTALPGPGAASDVLVADLDGDTLAELIVASANVGEITVLGVDP